MKSTISIAWQNLLYEVTEYAAVANFGQKKVILQALNGTFESGTLNGLMGPSGAGKTTLLNCISGQNSSALSSDSMIYVKKDLVSVSSYFIEQHIHERMFGSMTVHEILKYAFAFKNGQTPKVSRMMADHIDLIMQQLMLPEDLLKRQFKNCSGGEQKRIAIGQELMALEKPNFLFIDEPTTGLDSSAAFKVMNCLKQLTNSLDYHQMTVVVSIHVPNHDILQLFDKLYVLAKGGICIYSGVPSAIESTLKQIINCGLNDDQQPIEELIKIACNFQTPTVLQLGVHFQAAEQQNLSSQLTDLKAQPSGLSNKRKSFQISDLILQISRLFSLTFITEWRLVLKQLLTHIIITLIFISLFNLDMVKPSGCASAEMLSSSSSRRNLVTTSLLIENINFLNLSVDLFWYIIMATACITLMPMVTVFKNEHQNRWYSLGTFYLSFNIISALQLIFFALIISFVIYFGSNQYTNDPAFNWTRFGHFLFSLILISILMQSIGQALGVLFLNSILSGLICSIIIHVIITMISDLIMNTSDIQSAAFIYFSDLVGVKYLFPYLIYIFYGIDRCSGGEISYLLLNRNINNPNQMIQSFIRTIGANIIILRLGTFLLMYFKFSNPLEFIWMLMKKRKKTKRSVATFDNFKLENPKSVCLKSNLKESTTIPLEDISSSTISLAWRNLSFYKSTSIYELNRNVAAHSPEILRNLNGQFYFGTLNALMGPSGAGKTTLLKVLNGQCKDRVSEGTCFYLNKYQPIETCFITQEVSTHLWPGVTAKQALIYASRLKNVCENEVDHEKIALKMLEQLDLLKTADTKLEKCSGGERKRLALAQELTSVRMPNLICIDEPTSGLDSNSSEIVISCLKSFAKHNNITIITSIHQPNSQILRMFDQLYVLSRGGICIYLGPPKAIPSHLSGLHPALADTDISDAKYSHEVLIRYSCLGHQNAVVQSLSQLNNQQFRDDSAILDDCQLVHDGIKRKSIRFSLKSLNILSRRYLAYLCNNQLLEWLTISLSLLMFSKTLVFFWNNHKQSDLFLDPICINIAEDNTVVGGQGEDSSAQTIKHLEDFKILQVSSAFQFFVHVIVNFLFSIKSAAHFFAEFPHLTNEHRNGWYSIGSFYLMKSVFEIAFAIPLLACYLYISDIFQSIRPAMYWYILGIMLLSIVAWQGMAHILVFLYTDTLLVQYMMQISINFIFIYLANFILPLPHLHYVYQFLANFSIARFTFEAIALLQYGFGQCDSRHEIQPMLYRMGIDDSHFGYCIIMLTFNLVLYRVLAIWLLVSKLNPANNRRQRVLKIKNYLSNLMPTKALSNGLSSSASFNV